MSTPSERAAQLSADEAATLPPAPALAETETVPPASRAGPGTVSFAPAGAEAGTLPPSGPMATGSAQTVTVPGYEILGELGRGGMGVVYKVKQTGLNRIVALKMILVGGHATKEDLQRFRTEAEAIARLQHPGIVQVFEVGEHDGLPFFSLEFCSGGSLKDKLAGTPLPPGEAAALVEKLARAMQAAHEKGVIHRDLKPANVLLAGAGRDSASGGREPPEASSGGFFLKSPPLAEPKITDFGLARKLDEAGQTATGAVMGTPSYMAPEQAGMASSGRQPGESAVGPPCDIYALGAILYECLVGRPPFRAATPLDTILQVVSAEPVPPSQLNASLPRDLETICLKCLHKEPSRRYASAAELAADLRRFLAGEPIQARPVGRLERGAKWVRRNPVVAALMTTVAVVLLLATVVAWSLAAWALTEAERKSQQLARARSNLFTAQLGRVAAVCEKDPGLGYELLHDYNACPIDLRDFAWGWYARQCKRDRLTLVGHALGVTSEKVSIKGKTVVAFSPDGKLLASGRGDPLYHSVNPGKQQPGIIKLWDVLSGQERTSLQGHTDGISSVAFSRDGKTLASGSFDRTIRLWDVATGQSRRVLQGHTVAISSVAISLDGKSIASGSVDNQGRGELKLWDVTTGQERASLQGHTGGVNSVVFSNDGKTIASGGNDRKVLLWDVATGQSRGTLGFDPLLAAAVFSVDFSPDGKTLASGGGRSTAKSKIVQGQLKLWDMATKQERASLKVPRHFVWCVAFSPDGKTLVSGCENFHGRGELKLWDVATEQERASLKGHAKWVTSVAFSPDSKTLASGSNDGTIKLWDVVTGQERALLGQTSPACSVAFSPDSKTLASGSICGEIKLWDVVTGQSQATLRAAVHSLEGPQVWSVVFSPDGKTLASGGGRSTAKSKIVQGEIKLWDVATGQERATLKGHTGLVKSVAFSSDGKTLASGSDDKTLKLWDVATGQQRASLEVPTAEVRSVAFSPDGKTLVSGSNGGKIRRWDVVTAQELAPLNKHTSIETAQIFSVAFSPDGKTLAWGGEVWDLALGKDRFDVLEGRLLPGEITLWDVATGQERATLKGHTSGVRSVAFSPDGKTLASGSMDNQGRGELKLWDVTTGQERASLQGHTSRILSVAFSPDGKTLASGGQTDDLFQGGELKLWDMATSPEYAVFQVGGRCPLAFSRDGKILAATIHAAWEVATGYETTAPSDLIWVKATDPSGLTWAAEDDSPDGRLRAAGTKYGTIQLTDIATGRLLTTYFGHPGPVCTVRFHPNGTLLASSSEDGTVRLWKLPETK